MQKNNNLFTIDVHVSAGIFRRFAIFNAFKKQRRWISLTLFAGIMITFASIALIAKSDSNQAMLLFYVLLAVGILLPLAYFYSYLASVNMQIRRMKLTTSPRYVYTLSLDPDNFGAVVNTIGHVYPWADIHAVYQRNDCTYIYISPQQAYLLPNDQLDTEALCEMLRRVVPSHILHT